MTTKARAAEWPGVRQALGQAPGMQKEEDRVPGFQELRLVGDVSAA